MVVDIKEGAGVLALELRWCLGVDEVCEELVGFAGVSEVLPAVVVLGFEDSDDVDVLWCFGDGAGFGRDQLAGDVEL